ncbi:MAG: methyltransferase domain-containing protein [Euryarchaeota archaeon]|nr:methyltransferase domain-containing protein [Euryarchaeota archaeon]MDE2045299.1 methyltransferase domain-containing protein [Thermoplasmata archaeon]
MRSRPTQLVKYYRTAENWRRYTPADEDRTNALSAFVEANRASFGKRVLDLACGGGVLAVVLDPTGRAYVGVDLNPDMIRAARSSARARNSRSAFVLGDITKVPVNGRFDTVTLLGNALCHVNTRGMLELLEHLASHVHRGSRFLVDYRDAIGMFWRGHWTRRPYVQRRPGRGTITSRTTDVDFEAGVIRITATPSRGGWSTKLDHAMWSPFVLEPLMAAQSWELVKREMGRAPPRGRRTPTGGPRCIDSSRARGSLERELAKGLAVLGLDERPTELVVPSRRQVRELGRPSRHGASLLDLPGGGRSDRGDEPLTEALKWGLPLLTPVKRTGRRAVDVATLGKMFSHISVSLDERSRRLVLASEARALGRGGIEQVHKASGAARSTISRGIREIEGALPRDAWRVRRYGGGRKKLVEKDPTLLADLVTALGPGVARGSQTKSVRALARELASRGHQVSYPVVAEILKEAGLNRGRAAGTGLPKAGPPSKGRTRRR